ncbi:MAG: ATP-dependent DNA helicase RecG [Clostridia bacterium]|nr:ATP-dependent DNA helicase RecG [Clostridia bacterium]
MDERSPITMIPGIGAARAAAFGRMGIVTVGDLLRHFPRTYQNRGTVRTLGDGPCDSECSYILNVSTQPKIRYFRRNMSLLSFRASDGTGTCEITFFNQPFYKNQVSAGAKIRFFGKLVSEKGFLKLKSPSMDPVVPGRELEDIVPIYRISEGLTQKTVRTAISSAVKDCVPRMKDYMPDRIRLENGLATLQFALREIHFPTAPENLDAARKRLRFDEMFIFSLSLHMARKRMKNATAPRMSDTDISPFLGLLPFPLTGAQSRAVNEICSDMSKGDGELTSPMNRIVSGDVGSGKTAVAAIAAYIAIKNGTQAALMAPTEILAAQHMDSLSVLFGKLGISVALLTGSVPQKKKNEILCDLSDGRIDLIIGTHSLISEKVMFKSPGLFITDEQHRFGVMQRAALAKKADDAHVLVMSATPIPRTLALSLYGDLEISVLDELPPGRKLVRTFIVDESYRERLDAFICRQVSEKHQVYVVCPSVEGSEESEDDPEIYAAVEYADSLAKRLPDVRISCMHGRLPSAEKDEIMDGFVSRKTDVLVSTTVIEVGVNVPNATLMIIENADRFGLSQLHQLRGRVGRGSAESFCVLVSSAHSAVSRERLEVMRTTYDGFKIAERDLQIRGPGDFFSGEYGIRQHGGLNFRFASSFADSASLERVIASSKALLGSDPDLSLPENAALAEKAAELAGLSHETMN